MSDDVGPHLTSDDEDDTSTDLMTFCTQLVHHSHWTSRRTFYCGSSVEIPLCLYITSQFGVNQDLLDIDRMHYNTSHYAAHRSVTLPEAYTGSVVRIYTDDVHTGYVRLIKEKDNTELQLSDLTSWTGGTRHGPAIL